MADVQPCSNLGVTALLDELLGTGCGREPPPSSPVYDPREPTGSDHFARGSDSEGEVVTPRSKQIAELSAEMDMCLASLGKWEEESRLRVEALRKEMEVKYGMAFDPRAAGGRIAAWEAKEREPSEPEYLGSALLGGTYRRLLENEELVTEAYSRALHTGSPIDDWLMPGSPGSLMATSPCRMSSESPSLLLADRPLLDPSRIEDEARIARLRAEVEALRLREQEMAQEIAQQWAELEAAGADRFEDEGDAEEEDNFYRAEVRASGSACGAPSTTSACFGGSVSNLSALCREADSLLGVAPPSPGRPAAFPPPRSAAAVEDLAVIEARLVNTHGGLKHMEAMICSARSLVDSELSELERMLAREDGVAALGA